MTTRKRNAYYLQPSIPDYETAHKVFENFTPLRNHPNTVSLHRNGSVDYTLERRIISTPVPATSRPYYMLCRNGKIVIKYSPPVRNHASPGNKIRFVEVFNQEARSMHTFFRHHGWQGWVPQLDAIDGRKVYVPFVPGKETRMAFNENGLLIQDMSKHAPLFVKRSSHEQKQAVASVWALVEPIANLALAQFEDLKQRSGFVPRYSGSFDGINVEAFAVDGCDTHAVRDVVRCYAGLDAPMPLEKVLPTFMALALETVCFLASQKYAKAHNIHWQMQIREAEWQAVTNSITPEDFLRSYKYVVLKCCDLHKANIKVPLPQFPEHMPRRVFL